MMSRDLDQDKWIFLDREFLDSVIRGAFGHAGFYRGEKDDPLREKLRGRLRDLLREYAVAYESDVSDETHNNNILELAGTLSQEFGAVMKDGHFPIGVAQKSLNLYLKYLWCMGRIRTPPHCPFDSEVLREAEASGRWTRLDDIGRYKLWVEKARSVAARTNSSLSEWELRLWNKSPRQSL